MTPQHHPGALRPLTHPDGGATPKHGTIATSGNRSRQVDQPVPGQMPNPAPIKYSYQRAGILLVLLKLLYLRLSTISADVDINRAGIAVK